MRSPGAVVLSSVFRSHGSPEPWNFLHTPGHGHKRMVHPVSMVRGNLSLIAGTNSRAKRQKIKGPLMVGHGLVAPG